MAGIRRAKGPRTLFLATVFVVHLPKLLGGLWALQSVEERRKQGGISRVVGGLLLELLISTLVAPLLMLTQTAAVLSIISGRDAGWGAAARQRSRELGEILGPASMAHGMGRHGRPHLLGNLSRNRCVDSPVLIGLMFAPAIARFVAQPPGSAGASLLSTPTVKGAFRAIKPDHHASSA